MHRYIRMISIAFICSTLALAYFGYVLLDRFGEATKYTEAVNHTYEIINKLEQLESFAKDAEMSQRGFVITNDSAYLNPLFDIQHKIYPLADTLVHMTTEQRQKERLIMLKAAVVMLMRQVDYNVQLVNINNKGFFKKGMDDGKRLMDGVRTEIAQIKTTELSLLAHRNNAKENYLKSTSTAFISVLFLLYGIIITIFILLIKELRKRNRIELQLQQQIVELRQFTKESEELSYAVSHDLQEPLRKMRIFTDRLLNRHKDALDEGGKQIVQRMNTVAATAQDTMNELLRFTSVIPQIEEKTFVDLNILVKKVWENMAEKVLGTSAIIKVETLPSIKGVEPRLTILFENLFSNALVFSKTGIAPEVNIRAYKTKGTHLKQTSGYKSQQVYHAIEISDNGIGFADEYAVKIFQLFRRLHNDQIKYAGKGIGLAICHRIISNHHGYINATAKVGEGAVFTVYFPIE